MLIDTEEHGLMCFVNNWAKQVLLQQSWLFQVLFLSTQNVGWEEIMFCILLLPLATQSMLKANLGVLYVTNEHIQW